MTQSGVRLSLRIDLPGGRFGPGKAALLRAISAHGSISAAARQLRMSYARAWKLTEAMNSSFRDPLVETFSGGSSRGGAQLTLAGQKVLELYTAIEHAAVKAAGRNLASLSSLSNHEC
ncbi:MAG: LysR family transcriptional regulator [Gammaproteobacteria bacterium]|nr:LysR family transcriptional regulator [Gammaproteobacteria bacterium]